jgi:hypothetical protein
MYADTVSELLSAVILGYDDSGWDVAFFWRSSRCLWTDMGETGFGHDPGWHAFLGHRAIAERVGGWDFGSELRDGTHFLFARVAEKDFYTGVVSLIDDVFRTGSNATARASTQAEIVGLLCTGEEPNGPANRSRAVADMVRWLDRWGPSEAT